MVKSNDFEVHLIGTTNELKLSRALVNEMSQYDIEIFPEPVRDKLKNMLKFYSDTINAERYENGI
jgi:hypothetical protein